MPRGLRNNNPGDLAYDPQINWMGQVGSDPTFVIFSDMSYGLRALAMDLANKITKDGLTTITQIINVYAPASENDTASYISSVAGDTGLDPNAPVPQTQSSLAALMRAIINHELGDNWSVQYVQDADIAAGIAAMPAPLLSLFVNGPNIVDQNQDAFGFVLLGLIFGAAWLIK
jgi:hypothetical protein